VLCVLVCQEDLLPLFHMACAHAGECGPPPFRSHVFLYDWEPAYFADQYTFLFTTPPLLRTDLWTQPHRSLHRIHRLYAGSAGQCTFSAMCALLPAHVAPSFQRALRMAVGLPQIDRLLRKPPIRPTVLLLQRTRGSDSTQHEASGRGRVFVGLDQAVMGLGTLSWELRVLLGLEKKSLIQQARLFHRHDVVIAYHGASMIHFLFVRPDAVLVDLRPSSATLLRHPWPHTLNQQLPSKQGRVAILSIQVAPQRMRPYHAVIVREPHWLSLSPTQRAAFTTNHTCPPTDEVCANWLLYNADMTMDTAFLQRVMRLALATRRQARAHRHNQPIVFCEETRFQGRLTCNNFYPIAPTVKPASN
jgi:hypothetical protein